MAGPALQLLQGDPTTWGLPPADYTFVGVDEAGLLVFKQTDGTINTPILADITVPTLAGSTFIFNAATGRWENHRLTAGIGVSITNGNGSITISADGGANYQGAWNAATNTPTLVSSVGTKGFYYVVSVDGSTNLNGITDWKVGDWAIFNGSVWQKVDNTDAVTSIIGTANEITASSPTGAVTLSLPSALTFTGKTITGGTFASPTLTTPALGTPSAAVLTSATGLPLTTGVTGTLPVTNGGTGRATSTTAYGLIAAGTTATGAQQTLATGATTDILVSGGASALPVWTTASGSGAPVRATSPTITTPTISSITAAAATDLTLTGGSSGASLTLGQGGAGAATFNRGLTATKYTYPDDGNAVLMMGRYSVGVPYAYFQTPSNGTNYGWLNAAGSDLMRLSGTNGNLLIGGTTDITGSGGLKVFGTTAATSTTTGSLQTAGGLGVAGASYFGGQANFQASMPQIVLGAGSTAVNQIGFLYSSGGQYLGLSGNRNPATGILPNTAGTHAGIDLDTGAAGSSITFRTTATPNTLGNLALFINKNQGLEPYGDIAMQTAGKTLSVKSGANALAGTVTLVGGTATITSTAIDVNTAVMLSVKTASGTIGDHTPSIKVNAGNAVITGSSSDDSTYNWIALKVS